MLKKTLVSRDIELFVDVHGHSRKSNVFMYGCNTSAKGTLMRNNEKVFPFLLGKMNKNFDFNDCSFKISKDKEGTGRVVVCKDLNIANSYTLESSFCGPQSGEFAECHFTPDQLEGVGADFCRALFLSNDKDERAKAKLDLNMRFPPPPKEKGNTNNGD
jgi:hypothetical protein